MTDPSCVRVCCWAACALHLWNRAVELLLDPKSGYTQAEKAIEKAGATCTVRAVQKRLAKIQAEGEIAIAMNKTAALFVTTANVTTATMSHPMCRPWLQRRTQGRKKKKKQPCMPSALARD